MGSRSVTCQLPPSPTPNALTTFYIPQLNLHTYPGYILWVDVRPYVITLPTVEEDSKGQTHLETPYEERDLEVCGWQKWLLFGFKTNANAIDSVKVCQDAFDFDLPSIVIEKRKKLFCHASIHLHDL